MPEKNRLPTWIGNLLLVCISIALPLLCGELALRLLHYRPVSFDDRSFRRSPWTFKPNSYAPSYVGVPVRINNLGLRGEDTTLRKASGTFRILALGDSITFGYGVRSEDTFLEVLQRRLNDSHQRKLRYEVLNAGVPATGLEYYAHFLESRGAELDPDLILICMALNDIDSSLDPDPVEPQALHSALHKMNDFALTHSYLFNALYVPAKSLLYHLNVLKLRNNEGFGFLAIEPPSPEQDHARAMTSVYLKRIAQDAKQLHRPMAVVIFPVEVQLSNETRQLYAQKLHLSFGPEVLADRPQKWVEADGQKDGFAVLDLLPALRAIEQQQPFLRNRSINVDPVHPSVAGHAAAGEAIAAFLEKNALVP